MRVPPLDFEAFTDIPFPVATRRELKRKGLVQVDAMGGRFVVLWNDGRPRMYDDVCPHLGLPLSMGRDRGDRVQCAYHGWAFSADDGEVVEQPTLRRKLPCRLIQRGCLMVGDLVFGWLGDPKDHEHARSMLPEKVIEGFSLFRLVFPSPFYLALFSSVDYAHFPYHTGYKPFYKLYRRLGRDNEHQPGTAFPSKVIAEDERRVTLRIEDADRTIHMYATCSEMDDQGINYFQTYVTPISPTATMYWECYRPRSRRAAMNALARATFRTVTTRLLDGEDKVWQRHSTPNFLQGENIHLSENDAPLGAHLRKFVLPRLRALDEQRAARAAARDGGGVVESRATVD